MNYPWLAGNLFRNHAITSAEKAFSGLFRGKHITSHQI